MHFEIRIAFDKECCFLQEIYKNDYALCIQVILRNRVRLKMIYSYQSVVSFLKIGVTRAIFSLSGKTPFAQEISKIFFRITDILSDTFLTTSAEISSYSKLLFVLRFANAFATTVGKIFETSFSFHAKYHITGKFYFLFFSIFLLVLTRFFSGRKTEH